MKTAEQDKIRLFSQTQAANFYLFTDGSGHEDGYGGASAIALAAVGGRAKTIISAATGTTVERQEITAMLDGLQIIVDWQSQAGILARIHHPIVFWYTDREAAALSAWRKEDGEPFYRRKSAADLWARFEWYEKKMRIIPIWTPRKDHPIQHLADGFASEARLTLKDWVLYLIQENRLPFSNVQPK